ncbi:hypothetical protein [Janthinobacterium aquaticum]|uniref:hypothetical protein n=1 Tax=Janthinobacterium sp. FT58W TaxID=2654254 RepID=UPI001264B8D1|nr:hypothetical protein [Janthinobacterium sp. FT58W]KAB8042315.1 hypothetical protein GCM43_14725 [Janthinobacterium sp. FT58W]
MKKNQWKNNGSLINPLYDFIPAQPENEKNINLENKKIISGIENNETKNSPWVAEIKKLPYNLLCILLEELKSGNSIISINSSNWPQNGSIVVKLRKGFKKENKNIKGTKWRLLNDPHYCNEEITEILNDIEFLIIN